MCQKKKERWQCNSQMYLQKVSNSWPLSPIPLHISKQISLVRVNFETINIKSAKLNMLKVFQ